MTTLGKNLKIKLIYCCFYMCSTKIKCPTCSLSSVAVDRKTHSVFSELSQLHQQYSVMGKIQFSGVMDLNVRPDTLADLGGGGGMPGARHPLWDPILSFLHTFSPKSAHIGGPCPPPNGCTPPQQEIMDPPLRYIVLLSLSSSYVDLMDCSIVLSSISYDLACLATMIFA